ncbi:alpha/beta hydrolase [Gymnodinialimonas hymeniacidonis]|uniref:alpha/beta hydrolase n=1 Tax=Gymnodinialimonas hymeniacidonis TaxID=3126508 RepID=UPI0034C5C196
MHFFYTRRKYDPATDTFTDEVSNETSYVVLPHEGHNTGQRVDQATWLQMLEPQMGADGVAIFIHGFNTSVARMLWSLRKLKAGLKANGFDGDVIAFSWPCGGGGPLKKYIEDHEKVQRTARSIYEDGVGPIYNLPGNQRVHAICHSMGSYALKTCLNGLGGVPFDKICLFAGDVRSDGFMAGNGSSELFGPWSSHFTNYYNAEDFPLGLAAHIKRFGSRAGKVGLPHPTAAGFTDVDCTARYWDFVNSGGNLENASHRFYFADQSFLRDVSLTLQGHASDKRGPAPSPPDHTLLP